jgi:putative PIN family toxin of toxin-antitoxin system
VSTATLDTNVLASGFAAGRRTSPPAQIVDAWRARLFTLATSEHILSEPERTFTRPYFARFLTPQEAADAITLLRSRAVVTTITVVVEGVATHPEDDLVLATAVSAGADYLVTGDQQLQQLGRYQGVTIVSPRRFLELLAAERTED